MKLYSYFRSSASYRVRIALNLKGLPYEVVPVHLIKHGGEQLLPAYRKLNPNGLVPTMIIDMADNLGVQQQALAQSLAIIEYLDEVYPAPPILPKEALDRAYVRGIALLISCDIHPLNNLRVLRYLKRNLDVSEDDRNAWYQHWCEQGLAVVEQLLVSDERCGKYCCGDMPSLADCFLIPQIDNAQRSNCDLSGMSTLLRIRDACMRLDAFIDASPDRQPG